MSTTAKRIQYLTYRYKGLITIFILIMFVMQNVIYQEEAWIEMEGHGVNELEHHADHGPINSKKVDTDVHNHIGEDEEANKLAKEIRILCFILTYPADNKSIHVKETWGKRCNKLIFLSSENNTQLGAIDMHLGEGRQVLWGKSRSAIQYVYDNYLEDYEWFFKADTDTYVIMDNMRYMLTPYDPSFPIYFGSRFKRYTPQGYMSGGGGYVLSREAVKQFVEQAMPHKSLCRQTPQGAEDVEMGKCLYNIGVLAGDSRDEQGRGRMFPFFPAVHLLGNVPKWYLDFVYYYPDMGLNCCSDRPVSFHYMSPEKLYEFHYILYHVRVHGISHRDKFPAPLPLDKDSIPNSVLEKYQNSKKAED